MRFLKNIKKTKKLIEKVEVQGMLNIEGLLLKNSMILEIFKNQKISYIEHM